MASLYDLLAIILLHLRINSSKNYSLIFLHFSTLIYSILLYTNTPRITNQSDHSIPQFLLFTLMIPLFFLEDFYIFLIFYATPKLLPQGQAQDDIKKAAGREPPTTCTCPWLSLEGSLAMVAHQPSPQL